MNSINKNKPVFVTGATGYIAGWLVKKLLEEGITVHAAVRDPDNKNKLKHLDKIAGKATGNIHYFKADLLDEGSFEAGMEGCELVFHTASPFTSKFKNPQKELVDPAVLGTRNVLEQAGKTDSVKRVVLTSSCAAIYNDCKDLENIPDGILTEEIWNTSASLKYQPYSYSKTLAEKEAWKIHDAQSKWKLVVINPCMVMGPVLNPQETTSESINILKQFGDGKMKMGVPNMGIGLVDVRDVAMAHFNAGYTPEAEGRHINCAHNTTFLEMANTLKNKYGKDYPIPTKAIPKGLLLLVGPMLNKTLDRKFIRNNVNRSWRADNSKSREALGITYRSLDETMNDAFQSLIDANIIHRK
jgi:nucleoside-diphosphate-sugar epimerase